MVGQGQIAFSNITLSVPMGDSPLSYSLAPNQSEAVEITLKTGEIVRGALLGCEEGSITLKICDLKDNFSGEIRVVKDSEWLDIVTSKEDTVPSQKSEFEKKTYVERRKIETDRFFEGIRRQHDPRNDGNYDLEWVNNNAAEFSRKWKECVCKSCINFKECGFNLVTKCDRFSEEKK